MAGSIGPLGRQRRMAGCEYHKKAKPRRAPRHHRAVPPSPAALDPSLASPAGRRRTRAAGAKTTLSKVPTPAVIPSAANAGFVLMPSRPKDRTVESMATTRLRSVAPSSSGWSRLSTTKMP